MAISEAMALLVSGLVSPRTTRLPIGTVPRRTHAAADAGVRIVVRGLEVVDILRQLLRIVIPKAGLIDLVQIGIEDHHRLQREDLVHQFSQLRARLDVKIHLQGAARELVEIVHLAAPGVGSCGVLGDTRGKPADYQRGQHEGSRVTELAASVAGLNAG